jgi:hypothetical protein
VTSFFFSGRRFGVGLVDYLYFDLIFLSLIQNIIVLKCVFSRLLIFTPFIWVPNYAEMVKGTVVSVESTVPTSVQFYFFYSIRGLLLLLLLLLVQCNDHF